MSLSAKLPHKDKILIPIKKKKNLSDFGAARKVTAPKVITKSERSAAMHKQTLKNLLAYHRNLQFEDFCKDIYPDFDTSQSDGYLREKYALFKHNLMIFLAQLDSDRLERLSETIFNRSNSNGH